MHMPPLLCNGFVSQWGQAKGSIPAIKKRAAATFPLFTIPDAPVFFFHTKLPETKNCHHMATFMEFKAHALALILRVL